MNKLTKPGLSLASALGVALVACAPTMPPKDLVSARAAYDDASNGPAQHLNPADLHDAKLQLDVAESTFADEGDTQNARDQAYLSVRKTELASVIARTRRADMATDAVVETMHENERSAVATTASELNRTRDQLAAKGEEVEDANARSAQNEARRIEAEARAAKAAADLARIGTVKQEPRGMVITLSGAVLFQSAQSELMPAAQVKLNDVAKALIEEDPLSTMVIEGHTDSQGGADFNQTLSQKRAESVRAYLVTQGVAADRITAQGLGLTRPVASNDSPEGRANNRRVEIIVQPKAQ